MASLMTELMTEKDADLDQQRRIITNVQKQLAVFCEDMLHHMQVTTVA